MTLVDPDGKPVVGAETRGLTYDPWDYEPTLRAASFPLRYLNPDRRRRITFIKEDRQLIGFLLARGDGDAPYTVDMQPWGSVTGRIVDEHGQPAKTIVSSQGDETLEINPDPEIGIFQSRESDENGQFRIDQLIPGQHYSATMGRNMKYVGVAFENLTVGPGEVRDLGDIRSQPPIDVRDK